jgi:putative tryptophan/tyrosine transport system permease protein
VQAILTSGLQQGLLYGFMVMGVFLTFRVLDFPDLTVDGSITLGAAVTGAMAVQGHPVALAMTAGMGAGVMAGVVTGSLHLILKSGQSDAGNYGPKLLAGILTMTGLYTVNLRVLGRSNVPLLTGDNEQMIRSLGANTDALRVAGLGIANGLVALTGSVVAQQQGFADIGMGVGTIVAGLAGVIIGEVIFGARSITLVLFSVIGGSIVYRVLIAAALRVGWIQPIDLKLLTAFLVVMALATPTIRRKVVRM